eukprot:1183564-Prorocentrum_minimum.AAC.2
MTNQGQKPGYSPTGNPGSVFLHTRSFRLVALIIERLKVQVSSSYCFTLRRGRTTAMTLHVTIAPLTSALGLTARTMPYSPASASSAAANPSTTMSACKAVTYVSPKTAGPSHMCHTKQPPGRHIRVTKNSGAVTYVSHKTASRSPTNRFVPLLAAAGAGVTYV